MTCRRSSPCTRPEWSSRITPRASASRATTSRRTSPRSSRTGPTSVSRPSVVRARRPRRQRVDGLGDRQRGSASRMGRRRHLPVRERVDPPQGRLLLLASRTRARELIAGRGGFGSASMTKALRRVLVRPPLPRMWRAGASTAGERPRISPQPRPSTRLCARCSRAWAPRSSSRVTIPATPTRSTRTTLLWLVARGQSCFARARKGGARSR